MSTEGKQVFPDSEKRRPRRKQNVRLTDRYQQLLDGVITIDDLDEEEILRGKLRNANGSFGGPIPRVIPWTMHEALRSTMEKRMQRKMAEALPDVIDSLIRVAKYSRSGAARVQAAEVIMNRVFGKVPDKAEVHTTVTARWEDAAKGGRIFVDLEPEAGDVVDAELVEEEKPAPVPPAPPQVEIEARAVPTRRRTGVTI